jgi:hypothetical protein
MTSRSLWNSSARRQSPYREEQATLCGSTGEVGSTNTSDPTLWSTAWNSYHEPIAFPQQPQRSDVQHTAQRLCRRILARIH